MSKSKLSIHNNRHERAADLAENIQCTQVRLNYWREVAETKHAKRTTELFAEREKIDREISRLSAEVVNAPDQVASLTQTLNRQRQELAKLNKAPAITRLEKIAEKFASLKAELVAKGVNVEELMDLLNKEQ